MVRGPPNYNSYHHLKGDGKIQSLIPWVGGKPDEETRSSLKSNGFRWAPSAGAWQRQLNDNAIYAAGRVDCIRPLTGESPCELQKRVQAERLLEADGSELVSEDDNQEEPDQDHGMRMG